MKKIRNISYYMLVVTIISTCYISLGASDGTYGRTLLSDWGYVGQRQQEEVWCMFTVMSIFMRNNPTQCFIATKYAEDFFKMQILPVSCCSKPLPTSGQGYTVWGTYCLIRGTWKSMPYFVYQHLQYKSLEVPLLDHVLNGKDIDQNLYPCIGLDYRAGHAIIINGVIKSSSFGYTRILMHYFDPWTGGNTYRDIYQESRTNIYCLIR